MEPNPSTGRNSSSPRTPQPRESFADIPSATASHYSARFIAGMILITGSFLVYLAYPVILIALPASGSIKVGATIAASVLSWGIFSLGIFLAGTEGYEMIKTFCRRAVAGLRRKNSKQPVASVKRNTL